MSPKPPQYHTYGQEEPTVSSMTNSRTGSKNSLGFRKLSVKDIQSEILGSPIFQKVRQLYHGDIFSSQHRADGGYNAYPGPERSTQRIQVSSPERRDASNPAAEREVSIPIRQSGVHRRLNGASLSAPVYAQSNSELREVNRKPSNGYLFYNGHPPGRSSPDRSKRSSTSGVETASHLRSSSQPDGQSSRYETSQSTLAPEQNGVAQRHSINESHSSGSPLRKEIRVQGGSNAPLAPPGSTPRIDEKGGSASVNEVIYRSQPNLSQNTIPDRKSRSFFRRSGESNLSAYPANANPLFDKYSWRLSNSNAKNMDWAYKPPQIDRFYSDGYMDQTGTRTNWRTLNGMPSKEPVLRTGHREIIVPTVIEGSSQVIHGASSKASDYNWHSLKRPDENYPPSTMFGNSGTLRAGRGGPPPSRPHYRTINPKLSNRLNGGMGIPSLARMQNLSHSEGDIYNQSDEDIPDIGKIATPPPDYDLLESTSSSDDEASYNHRSKDGDGFIMFNKKYVDVSPSRDFYFDEPMKSMLFGRGSSNKNMRRRHRDRRRYSEAARYQHDLTPERVVNPPNPVQVPHAHDRNITAPASRTYGNVAIDQLSHPRPMPRKAHSTERRSLDASPSKSPARTPSTEPMRRRQLAEELSIPKRPARQSQQLRRLPPGFDTSDGSGFSSTLGRFQHSHSNPPDEPPSSILNNTYNSDYNQSDRDSSFSGRKSSRKRVQFEDEIRKDFADFKARSKSKLNE